LLELYLGFDGFGREVVLGQPRIGVADGLSQSCHFFFLFRSFFLEEDGLDCFPGTLIIDGSKLQPLLVLLRLFSLWLDLYEGKFLPHLLLIGGDVWGLAI
jgi:hypothetical protein